MTSHGEICVAELVQPRSVTHRGMIGEDLWPDVPASNAHFDGKRATGQLEE